MRICWFARQCLIEPTHYICHYRFVRNLLQKFVLERFPWSGLLFLFPEIKRQGIKEPTHLQTQTFQSNQNLGNYPNLHASTLIQSLFLIYSSFSYLTFLLFSLLTKWMHVFKYQCLQMKSIQDNSRIIFTVPSLVPMEILPRPSLLLLPPVLLYCLFYTIPQISQNILRSPILLLFPQVSWNLSSLHATHKNTDSF